jgi:hypothetical protein
MSRAVLAQKAAVPAIVRGKSALSGSPTRSSRDEPSQSARVLDVVDHALATPGHPLDHGARSFFEKRFGHDFSSVRIHTDNQSVDAAKSLHSAAFTVGNDIVFGSQRYAPATPRGRLLLFHELRHVAQQRSAARPAQLELDPSDSSHESQARCLFNPNITPLAVQRVQCSPEDAEFSLGGGAVDSVGKSVFGESTWPFLKAVFEGFVSGLKADVKSGRADAAKDHLLKLFVPWNAVKFYGGYLLGLGIGLVSPITDLVKGIIGAVRLSISALEWAVKWSPAGIAVSPERQQKIVRLIARFGDLAIEWGKAVDAFLSDPVGTIKKVAGFLENLMQMALGKAHELGARAAHSLFDFLQADFFPMGKGIGEVIGALVAQVLLAVFSEAIGNLISKGASLLGKAAEFVAGKAVEIFEWVKGFATEIMAAIRSAVKGALKLFEGLANKAIEAFDALKAIFIETESLNLGAETAAAGVGKVGGRPLPNIMESRMVKSTRTAPAKVADLTPPKVHPSKAQLTQPKTTAEAIEDLERSGTHAQPGEAAAIGSEIERMEVQNWTAELQSSGYRTYARNEFGQGRLGDRRLSQLFTDQRARPDMVAINDAKKTIIVGDITANPGTTATIPGRIGQEDALHIEKTIEYAKQLKRQLPPDLSDYKVLAQDRHWQTGTKTRLIGVD